MKAIIWSLYFHKCLYQVPIGGWQLKHIYKFHFLLKAGKSLIVQDHSYSLPKAWKDSFFSAKLVLHHLNKGKDSYWHTRKITNFIHWNNLKILSFFTRVIFFCGIIRNRKFFILKEWKKNVRIFWKCKNGNAFQILFLAFNFLLAFKVFPLKNCGSNIVNQPKYGLEAKDDIFLHFKQELLFLFRTQFI